MSRRTVCFVVAIVFLLITAGVSKKPKTIVDKTVDFNTYNTYAWVPGSAAKAAMMHTIITITIDNELQRVGLAKILDIRAADLLVRYDAAGGVQMSYTPGDPSYSASGGFPPPTATMWGAGGAPVTVAKGAIKIQLMDREKARVVWSSSLEQALEEKTSKRYLQVNLVVANMFKDFPRKK